MKKILLLLFILTSFLFASVGQITALVGDVKISRDSNTILAKLGEKLEKNDVINSAKASKAQVTLDDNTIITIGQNSTLNIFDYAYDETKPNDSKADIGFMKGSFKSITGKIGKINKERFKLKTKSASIGIRGTTIIGNQRIIACTDGAISVTAKGVTVNVDKQELTRTPQGGAPTPPEPLKQDTLNNIEQESGGNDSTGDNGENDDGGDNNSGDTGGGESTPPDVEIPNKNDDDKKNNINKEIDKEVDTATIKKEHSTLSNFSTLGYVNTIVNDSNEDFESFKNGEIGMNGFDSSSTNIESDSLKMKIFDNDITDAILTREGYFYDQVTNSNYLVWGEWSKDGNSGGWIAGTKTAKSVINGINDTIHFNGHVIHGNIYDGLSAQVYNIDPSSTVTFAFDFGGGSASFTGDINLIYNTSSNYDIHIGNNGVVNSSGFSSSDLTHNNNSITGNINGSFYGSGEIKAIGGKFDFEDGVIKGSGLFKAETYNP